MRELAHEHQSLPRSLRMWYGFDCGDAGCYGFDKGRGLGYMNKKECWYVYMGHIWDMGYVWI
jgi:hypothetical protein